MSSISSMSAQNTRCQPKAPPLYIHGLEGDVTGTKGRYVTENFGGMGPSMPASSDIELPDQSIQPGRLSRPGRPECFEDCFEVARDYVLSHPCSTIIGSSFGGAITLALLQRGVWEGPVVLLAPAGHIYQLGPFIPKGCHAVVIHDPSDEVVPYEGSELLVRENPTQAELWSSDGGHRLYSITDNGMFDRAIRAQQDRAIRAYEDHARSHSTGSFI